MARGGARARWGLGCSLLPHVSMGLGTILFGVSGNCDDREVTSLPDEFPREPDSEKDTWAEEARKYRVLKIYIYGFFLSINN